MRIITGKLKGRRIHIPKGLEVRPTTDRTKESIFNIIDARVYLDGAMILDLFAGSGSLGFEAISRGAKKVTAVESDPKNAKNIQKTAEQFDVEDQIRVVTTDVLQYMNGMPLPHHFIFCDPPYEYAFVNEIIEAILTQNWLSEEGWFIFEHDKKHRFKEHPHCFFSKSYGRTMVSIFQKHPVD
ncbi:MAG: 16S rRNA (guanine(966)-N(2))-methyltransferase RsmD [Balneolaceae bacterium]